MQYINRDIKTIRSRICDWALMALALFAIPALAASLSRSLTIGWLPVMWLHIFVALAVWILTLFRKKTPFLIRGVAIISILILIGLAGLLNLGLLSGAIPFLVIAPVMTTILFGRNPGISVATIVTLIVAFLAYASITGQLVPRIDVEAYIRNPASWGTMLFSLLLSVGTVTASIVMMTKNLSSALANVHRKKEELIALNHNLEHQVQERTQQLEQAKALAEKEARHDSLTGLGNRRALVEYVSIIANQAQRYQRSYVVAMVDIDHFKSVNDRYGHHAGDQILVSVAKILRSRIRKSDFVARVGGEEFALIFTETTLHHALRISELIRSNVETTKLEIDGEMISVTISIGLVQTDGVGHDFEQVLAGADTALYQAKNSGRNRVEAIELEG